MSPVPSLFTSGFIVALEGLSDQLIPVSLFGGIDSKTDPLQVAGDFLELENFTFQSPKALRTRNGYSTRGKGLTSGTSITAYLSELLATDRNTLYSYNAGLDELIPKGSMTSAVCTQRSIIRTGYAQNQPDCITDRATNQLISAWEDSSGGLRYSVIDDTTGQIVQPSTLLSATGIKAKTLVVDTNFVVLFVDVADADDPVLMKAVVPIGSPRSAPSVTAVSSGVTTEALNDEYPNFDACVSGNGLFITIANRVADLDFQGLTTFWFRPDRPTAVTAVLQTANGLAVTVFPDLSNGGIVIGYWDGATVRFAAYDAALNFLAGGPGAVALEVVADVVSITGVSFAGTTRSVRFFYGVSAADTLNYTTRTVTLAGTTGGTPALFKRSVSPAGKAFVRDDRAYIPLAYQSADNAADAPNLQSAYYLLDDRGMKAARVLYGLAGGIPARPDDTTGTAMLAETGSPRGDVWRMAGLVKDLQTFLFKADKKPLVPPSNPDNPPPGHVYIFSQLGVTALTFDFGEVASSYRHAELAQTINYGGGIVQGFDGATLTENNFCVYPEPFTVAITATSGGGMVAGVHRYRCVYAWPDNLGQWHRSSPSVPVDVTIAEDGSYTTLTIPTDRLSSKPGAVIEVYRTVVVGEVPSLIYYLVTTTVVPAASGATNAPILNDATVDTVMFVDKMDETAPIARPDGYWTGGVFENQCPNPLGALTVLHNRIFGIDTMNPLALWYSKQVAPGAPVEFSPWQTLNVDPRGGDVTAIGAIDAVTIAFKRSSIFGITGTGPSAAGGDYDFQDAERITTDVGCVSPRSVVVVPEGLMFQASDGKGFHLLNRGFVVSYIGAKVARYNNETVTSATLMADKQQVVFTLASGIALVYDYLVGMWTTYTNVNAADSTIWEGRHTFIRPTGGIRQETPDVYTDDGQFIPGKVVSGWIPVSAIQGFGRLRRALILGSNKSSHRLLGSIALDYLPGPEPTDITPPTPNFWGSDSVWGGNSKVATDTKAWGGLPQLYQFRLFPAKQKCEAFQFTLQTASNGAPAGEAVWLSAVTFVIAVFRGSKRMAAANSYGGK